MVDYAMVSICRNPVVLLFLTTMTPVSFPCIHLNDTGVKLSNPAVENKTHHVALVSCCKKVGLEFFNQIRVLISHIPGFAHVSLKVIYLER